MAQSTCSVEQCAVPVYAVGMCRPHYRRASVYGDPLYVRPKSICGVEGCDQTYHANGYCERHLGRVLRTGSPGPAERLRAERRPTCSVAGCETASSAKGLCPRHYQRFVRFGDPLHVPDGAHPDSPVRACKWCGTEFDSRTGGRLLCCSERCRRIIELLVKSIGRYSLTVAQYREMWVAQGGGLCGICRQASAGRSKLLAVDHDHACCPGQSSCGKCVRGLLCDRCNNALGCCADDPEILMAAAEYIEKHRDPAPVTKGT
jgi:hypothetical protein